MANPMEVMFHPAEQRPKIDRLPTRVLSLPESLETVRGQPRNADKALLGSLLQQEGGAQVTGALAHSLRGRVGRFLYEAWVRVGDRWVTGGLGGLPTPSVVLSAGGVRSTLPLLLALHNWQLWFSFCILFFIIWPNCSKLAVTFSPLGFLSILSLEAMPAQLQALQQRGPGPSLALTDRGP